MHILCWFLCPVDLALFFSLIVSLLCKTAKKGKKNIWGNDKMTQLVGGFRLGLYLNHSKDWVQCSENCFAVIICVNGSIPIHVTCMRLIEVHNLG